jgi:predicted lactoylglutathione lyase
MTTPRLSLVTLGVAEIARARAFYEALGWRASSASTNDVAFFDAGGVVLAVWGRANLADDAAVPPPAPATGSFACAINRGSEASVDGLFERAVEAGARPLKRPVKTEWGGYSGYFADLDGHAWEVAFNPFWPFDDIGGITLPA